MDLLQKKKKKPIKITVLYFNFYKTNEMITHYLMEINQTEFLVAPEFFYYKEKGR